MLRLYTVILHITVFLTSVFISAEAAESRHIILAFDLAPDGSYHTYRQQACRQIFQTMVDLVAKYDSVPLNENDRVSVIKYGVGIANPSLKDFAKVVKTSSNQPLSWIPYSEIKNKLSNNWDAVLTSDPGQIRGGAFSLLSGAKEYSLKAASPIDSLTASKVILINITDNYYNGADEYHKEFGELKGSGSPIKPDEFFTFKEDFWQNYHLNQLGNKVLLSNKRDAPFQMIYHEVTSATPMPLAGAIDFPPGLNFERVRGGYKIDFEARAVQDVYDIADFNVNVITQKGDTLWAEKTPIPDVDRRRGVRINLFIPSSAINSKDIHATVTGDLHQRDNIYDAYVLSHTDKHYPRLTQEINLSHVQHARVFGMNLNDFFWWFFPNDMKLAALLWEVILLLIVVGIVVYMLFRYNKKTMLYIPENSEITMHSVDKKLSENQNLINTSKERVSRNSKRE